MGPKNTFMWQGRELGLSALHPGRPPKWQRWGKLLSRPGSESRCLTRLALTGPSRLPSARVQRQLVLRRLVQFVQLSPKAAKPRGDFGPHPGHLCHSHSNRELVHSGSGRRGSEGASLCKLLAPQLPVTPVAHLLGAAG